MCRGPTATTHSSSSSSSSSFPYGMAVHCEVGKLQQQPQAEVAVPAAGEGGSSECGSARARPVSRKRGRHQWTLREVGPALPPALHVVQCDMM